MDSGANQGSESGLERLVAMVIRLADGHLFAKRLAPIPRPHPSPVFARRYTSVLISNEEAAQVALFRYVAAQGVKENLVAKVRDWPGVLVNRVIT